MRKIYLSLLLIFVASVANSQTAPPHLKYFGYALVDMYWDDPHDISTITNYTAEVDSFSNVAQLGVFECTDTIISRVNLMNSLCVKPFLSIQSIFYYQVDTLAPSGDHFVIYPNYQARWNVFKSTNLSVLDASKVAAFYAADEPVWNGITFSDLDIVCQLIKADFPDIPIMVVEAYPVLSSFEIPVTVDWVGFDRYEIFDPSTSTVFLNDLDTLKSKLSAPDQKIFLIIDDQWLPHYGSAGFSPDTMRYCVQNYYNLAASDTSIIGLLGYLWAGGLDDSLQLGVRDMPQSVIDKNVEIGRMIKTNNSPCSIAGSETIDVTGQSFTVYPNPATASVTVSLSSTHGQIEFVQIYNAIGVMIREVEISQTVELSINVLPAGLYFVQLKNYPGQTRNFIRE